MIADVRLALRMLLKKPGISALAVLTLALGIGANTAIFSVIHGVLLRELPYGDSERLVQVSNSYPLLNREAPTISMPDYFDRRDGVEAFEESAVFRYVSYHLMADGTPTRVLGLRVSASIFPVLQAEAFLGRTFTDEDDQPGRAKVVVLSHALWSGQLGADRAIVGQDIRLSGETYRVLGVMKPGFTFPDPRVRFYHPMVPTPEERSDASRGKDFFWMLARLAPSTTLEAAQQQLDAIAERNKELFPEKREYWEGSGFRGRVMSYREVLFGHQRPMLILLQAVVALVLLIACANVANLFLARLNSRRKEFAVRTALGAGRLKVARQILAESLVLGVLGGVSGILVAAAGLQLLSRFGVDPTAGTIVDVRLDFPVLAFTFVLSLVAGAVFGLLPILSLWRLEPNTVMKEGGGRGGSGRGAARQFLVIAEMAMAVMLLVSAGLLIRTFVALANEDPGFSADNVISAQLRLPEAEYTDDLSIAAFYEEALQRVRALPGVKSAGLISMAPFSGRTSAGTYSLEGYTPGESEPHPHALLRTVDEDYFETMEISLLAGRSFESSDGALDGGDGVVVVDRLLVEKYWPDDDPIERRLHRGSIWYRIVGVVEPIKIETLQDPIVKETIYFPYRQNPRAGMTMAVRTEMEPASLTASLRDAIGAVDPELPIYNIHTMEHYVGDSLQTQRVSMVLVVTFGALAVILASIGIYGVLSFTVTQRMREIGTRIALGASPREILRMVVGQGMLWTLAGLGAGVVASLALGRFLEALLFGVASWDPLTFLSVAPLLVVVSFLACYRPARYATRIDPLEALRDE